MSISVTAIPCSDRDEWTKAVERTVHDVFSSPDWSLVAAEIDEGEPNLIVASLGEQRMVAPVLLRRFRPDIRDAVSPYGYAGPSFSEQSTAEFRESALCASAHALRDQGAVTWFVRCNPIVDAAPSENPATLMYHGPTVSIDLKQDRDTRWSHMNSGHRYEIRRALREGLEVGQATSSDDWLQFRALYESTMIALKSRPYYVFSDMHWRRLREMEIAGYAKLVMARFESQPAGGAVFLCKPGTAIAHYHLSGTDPTFRRLNPSKAIIAHSQDLLADLGYSCLHLGGGLGAQKDSLYEFKRGFSPNTHRFHSRRLILDAERYLELCGATALPEQGHFPAYRG
jgi:hypothetical protein